jgi:hypothetical protein
MWICFFLVQESCHSHTFPFNHDNVSLETIKQFRFCCAVLVYDHTIGCLQNTNSEVFGQRP